jgi:predicted enzyme related to lactoylglutathione lyase/AraC-like DNA-binding protein
LAACALERGISVSPVTSRLGLLAKTFVRRFHHHVGLAPKPFSRVRRLQRILRSMSADNSVDWAALAAEHGYTDQAHLHRRAIFTIMCKATPKHFASGLSNFLRGIGMIANRSVPTDAVLPHVVYRDVAEAIAWLTKTFGFIEHYRYSEPIGGAQLHLGNAWIMLKRARAGTASPAQLGYGTQSLTVFVDDVDAHFQRVKAAGAKILEEIHETVYGEIQYGVEDLDGHHWLFSRHACDVSPDEWGATVSEVTYRLALLRRPRFCYLEIPAVDVHQSAAFYEKVFGWNIRHRDTTRPSFDDATGDVSGAWVTCREISREAGLLPSIWVDSIDATLTQVAAHGGAVVEPVRHDSPGSSSWIATFHDPAGNMIRLYQEGPR